MHESEYTGSSTERPPSDWTPPCTPSSSPVTILYPPQKEQTLSFPGHLPLSRLPLPLADYDALEMRIASKQENIDRLVLLVTDPAKRVLVPLSTLCPIPVPHVRGVYEPVPVTVVQGMLADAVIDHWWHVQYAAEHRKRTQST